MTNHEESFVDTPILGEKYAPAVRKMLQGIGVDFVLPEDCAKAALRIAADADINGKRAFHAKFTPRTKTSTIGRAFAIVPRQIKPEGYADIDHDDMKEGTLLYFFERAGDRQAQKQGHKSMREQPA
jgi:hypothetical protein